MFDESPDQPRDEENVEPTSAPDEGPETADAPETPSAEGDAADVPSAEDPADAPAEGDDTTEDAPAEPAADQAEGEPEQAEQPAAEADAEPAAAEPAAAEQQPAGEQPAQERARPGARRKRSGDGADEPEVIPGAHLEPDLVLEQQRAEAEGDEYAQYAEPDEGEGEGEGGEGEAAPAEEAPAVRSPLELAADARYQATGKRKTAIARVILKPGSGDYKINGKALDVYFPRPGLQTQARQPLEATGNLARMDVVARIHGGGVSAQATALRHGIARALVEAEPSLRGELKRRGYLTRDPREKERKKAGLKKARKRPQFSKR